MPQIYVCFDEADEALAAQLAARLRAGGATIVTEPVSDRRRSASDRADGIAASVKAADLVAVVACPQRESLDQAKRGLRAAFAYRRPIRLARRDGAVDFEALARAELGDERVDDAAGAGLDRVVDLDGAQGIEAFAQSLLKEAATTQGRRALRAEAPEDDADSLGFPRTPAAMLARWRLIQPRGDLLDLESFLSDYADDPYFAPRAAAALTARRRRRAEERSHWGFRATMAALLLGGLVYAGGRICAEGRCAPASDLSAAPSAPAATEAVGGDDGVIDGGERLRTAQERARAAVLEARAAERRLRSAREAAERREAALQAENAELRAAFRTAETERDRFASASGAAAPGLSQPEGAAPARSDPADATRIAALEASLEERRQRFAALQLQLRNRNAEIERLEAALDARGGAASGREPASRGSAARDAALQDSVARGPVVQEPVVQEPVRDAEPGRARDQGAVVAAGGAAAGKGPDAKGLDAGAPARSDAPSTSARPAVVATRGPVRLAARDPDAVRRVLSVMREEMDLAHRAARSAAAPPAKGALLSHAGVRLLQRCLRRGTGAPAAVDGLWGPRTTSALMSVDAAGGEAVADCLRERLRRTGLAGAPRPL